MKGYPTLFFHLILIAVLGCSAGVCAQNQYAFRISFTDKKGSAADIHSPSGFLSAAALARRTTQHIIIDSSDLPVSKVYTDSILHLSGGILHTRSRWLNNCVVLVADTAVMGAIRGKSFISGISYIAAFPAPLHYLKTATKANDVPAGASNPAVPKTTQLFKTTGSPAYYGDAYDQIGLANGDYLHNEGYRGKGKMIAVIDAGFYMSDIISGFDSLRLSGRIADTYNFNLDTNDVYGYSGHGTEVLSTMAGLLPGQYAGTAPDAQYALYVTENETTEQPYEMDNLVAAMERADSTGADVISISLGYNTFNIGPDNADLSFSELDGQTTIAARGANKATEKGILVVATAGNDGSNSWKKILTPGDADSALTVGNVTFSKAHVASSGTGPNAAGVLKPDVSMLGQPSVIFNTSGSPVSGNGTSFSTPELAGLAACLWQAVPAATPYQLRSAIRNSAHIAAAPNNELGYGVPDFGKALTALSVITDTPVLSRFSIAPNPFSSYIRIRLATVLTADLNWQLTDVQGRTLLSGIISPLAGSTDIRIDMPQNLPSGIYVLRAQANDWHSIVKITKAP